MSKKNRILICFMLIMSGFLMAACSKSEDSNKEVIRNVLEHQFNGPNEEFMDLMWNPKYKTVVDNKEENKEFDKYVTEKYGPYFTEGGLDFFIATGMGTKYQTVAYNNGYKLSLKKVTIEQNENNSNLYTFVAKIGYKKSGEEEKTANVEGKVTFSKEEDEKIGKFEYGNDDNLSDKLRE